MELLKVVSADYVEDYKIYLRFNNGNEMVVDLQSKLFSDQRPIFKPLRDKDYFKNFSLNTWTIEWQNGADLAPEALYNLKQEA